MVLRVDKARQMIGLLNGPAQWVMKLFMAAGCG
jgi:hypothetical protein